MATSVRAEIPSNITKRRRRRDGMTRVIVTPFQNFVLLNFKLADSIELLQIAFSNGLIKVPLRTIK